LDDIEWEISVTKTKKDRQPKDVLVQGLIHEDADRFDFSLADRKTALAYFGLDESANASELDKKYWQRIKQFRVDTVKNKDQLDEINLVYEIASGKSAEKKQIEEALSREKKYFGKTLKEWTVHFQYSWWKYALTILILAVVGTFVRQIFFVPKTDLKIVAIGHFQIRNAAVVDFAKERFGYLKPSLTCVDIIIDGSEDLSTSSMYGGMSSAAVFSIRQDIFITDAVTMPYYLDYYTPLDDFYEELLNELSAEEMEGIHPLYYSAADFYALPRDQDDPTETPELTEADYVKRVYGLMILDEDQIAAIGFENMWEKHPSSLVFCLSYLAKDMEASKEFIKAILIESNPINHGYSSQE
jgi:hypothetical protein